MEKGEKSVERRESSSLQARAGFFSFLPSSFSCLHGSFLHSPSHQRRLAEISGFFISVFLRFSFQHLPFPHPLRRIPLVHPKRLQLPRGH